MSLSTFCIWTACLVVAQTFPYLLNHLGPSTTFWIYSACSALTFLLVYVLLPETKGRTLEQIERSWTSSSPAALPSLTYENKT